jgi:hypothetical protein
MYIISTLLCIAIAHSFITGNKMSHKKARTVSRKVTAVICGTCMILRGEVVTFGSKPEKTSPIFFAPLYYFADNASVLPLTIRM